MLHRRGSVALSILWVCCAPTAAVEASSVLLAADSPHLQYTGRVAKNGSQVLWDWPGVKAGARLNCPAGTVNIQVHIQAPAQKLPLYWVHELAKYTILVDGVQVANFQTTDDSTTYDVTLPSHSSGARLIEVFKNTERLSIPQYWSIGENGPATVFSGITIPESCSPLTPPARPTRRLEFVGDSITCGFGNLVHSILDKAKCVVPPSPGGSGGWLSYEDFSLGIPTIASKEFQAETHTECISNVGITRNGMTLAKTTAWNMSRFIHRTLPTLTDPLLEWDYASWTPDLAIVNLGTNDYDISQIFHEQPSFPFFESHYTQFLNEFVSHYGGKLKAMLVLCGPMTKTQCPSVEKVAGAIGSMFPKLNVRYMELSLDHLGGCITHPDSAGDRSMYEMLAPVISNMTGWELPKSVVLV